MNRLQKKCFIVSMGIHLLLVVILLVGPAFLSRNSDQGTPQLNFIAAATVDAAISGGGDNSVKSPPAELTAPPEPVAPPAQVVPPAPVPPAPVPPPVVERTPPPVDRTPAPTPRETPREVKPPKPDAPVVESKPTKHKIEVSTKLVTTSSADAKAAQDAARKAAAAERRRADAAVGRAIAGIKGGVSGSTEIKLQGPGGGGVPYGNFYAAVQKIYDDAWSVPPGAPSLVVSVTVTIARDGTVLSARITDGSGNAALDDSVQKALDRVKTVPPLPESETRESRTFTIGFNPLSKAIG